jgi:hypothetical protein
LIVAIPSIWAAIESALNANGAGTPAWLASAGASMVVFSTAVARIMATPGVNDLLDKYFPLLAAAPQTIPGEVVQPDPVVPDAGDHPEPEDHSELPLAEVDSPDEDTPIEEDVVVDEDTAALAQAALEDEDSDPETSGQTEPGVPDPTRELPHAPQGDF